MADTATEAAKERQLSFGEKAVGLSFNPSQNVEVEKIKRQYADIIDNLNNLREKAQSPDEGRMLSLAITESQSAQMWAVKAVTWGK